MTEPQYNEQQYSEALAIVEAYEQKQESISVICKLRGAALEIVMQEKGKHPTHHKARIINRLLTELHQLRQKK